MRRPGLVTAFAFFAFSMAIVQALILWTGAAGVPLSRPLGWVVLLASIAIAALLAPRCGRSGAEPSPADDAASLVARQETPSRAASLSAWIAALATITFAILQWIGLWRLAWARPVYDWDGLYYHVPAMHGWATAGRVHWIPGMGDLPFVNGYPMAVEMLGLFFERLSGTSRLIDGGNLFFWPLAGLALSIIATALGARGPWRLATAGLISTVPAWVILSGTCYVDPAFATTVMATLAAALLFARPSGRSRWTSALLLGACGGLMIGTKGQGGPFFIVTLLLVSVFRAREELRGGQERAVTRSIMDAARAGLVAFAVGGYWALRNTMMTGNPIFPIQLSLGGKVIAPGYDTGALLAGNMPEWLAAWPAIVRMPVSWLQLDSPIRGFAATGGLGFVWLFAALPAVLITWWLARRNGPVLPMLALLTLLVGLFVWIQPAPWWARMTLWLHALGLPCLAVVLDTASRSRFRPAGLLAPLALLGVLALGVREVHGAFEAEQRMGRLEEHGAEGAHYRSSADYIFPGLVEECHAFFESRRIARGPWSRFGTLLGGVLAQPLGERRIVPIIGGLDEARLSALRDAGIDWIIWDEVQSGGIPAALREAAIDSCAYRPNDSQRFAMVRIGGIDQ